MAKPNTETLLSAWEQGRAHEHRAVRALALLGVVFDESTDCSLATLSIGERDSLLLNLREQLFGGQITALAVCPGCERRVETSFSVSDIRVAGTGTEQQPLCVCLGEYAVEFRLPNSLDLLVLTETEEVASKRERLLEQIVLHAECAGAPHAATQLPEEVILAMEAQMRNFDPQAEIDLRLRCQSCQREWSELFDIGCFLWKEVEAWALRLLREVHLLATAYGWNERDILAMSPWRRYAYLEMLSL